MVAEDLRRVTDSVKAFLYVHHLESWKTGIPDPLIGDVEKSLLKER